MSYNTRSQGQGRGRTLDLEVEMNTMPLHMFQCGGKVSALVEEITRWPVDTMVLGSKAVCMRVLMSFL